MKRKYPRKNENKITNQHVCLWRSVRRDNQQAELSQRHPPAECGHRLEKKSLSNMATGLQQSQQGPLWRLENSLMQMESGVKVPMLLSHDVPEVTAPEKHQPPGTTVALTTN